MRLFARVAAVLGIAVILALLAPALAAEALYREALHDLGAAHPALRR